MGRVKLDDLDKYNSGGGGNGANYFILSDDGDTAPVRIMLEKDKDLENYIFATHKVTIGEKAKYPNKHVNCLRTYNDPISKCPFCNSEESFARPSVRLFLPVFNIDADEVQFFDRPKGYVQKIQKIMHRFKDLPSHIFDIERNGEKGDKQTTYEFYETDEDETTIDDLPEIPDVLGTIVLDASEDDMEYFLEAGEFPPQEDDDDKPVRRRNKKSKDEDDDEEDVPFEEDEGDDEEEEKPRRRKNKTSERSERRTRRTRRNEDEF